jgi:hypothetical protein
VESKLLKEGGGVTEDKYEYKSESSLRGGGKKTWACPSFLLKVYAPTPVWSLVGLCSERAGGGPPLHQAKPLNLDPRRACVSCSGDERP